VAADAAIYGLYQHFHERSAAADLPQPLDKTAGFYSI